MSKSNKRYFNDERYEQSSFDSKRICISIVPTVPQGGSNYLNKYHIYYSNLSDIDLNSKEKLILDAGDRIINKTKKN